MELVYLLCSIVSTLLSSVTLSLLLPFRLLFRRFFPKSAHVSATDSLHLYEGTVWHERRRPVHHSFSYHVRYALIDLDHAPNAPPDHFSPEHCRRVAQTNGPVFLLTIPPSVGYEQNPLSLYYCYDVEGSTQTLTRCIAEVTNTPWGERVTFLFDPNSDLVAKPLHVSPFMDMLGNWSIRTNLSGENLFVIITVQHPKLGEYFTASLTAKRVSSLAADQSLFFWLMPHKVALWIYWNAVKLWWKNIPFIPHPRYGTPEYKEHAVTCDKNLQCCNAFAVTERKHDQVKASGNTNSVSTSRLFLWRDAKWPWN